MKKHTAIICFGFLFVSFSLVGQTESVGDSPPVSPPVSASSEEAEPILETPSENAINEPGELDLSPNNNQNVILLPQNSELMQRKTPVSTKGVLLENTEVIFIEKNQDFPTPIE